MWMLLAVGPALADYSAPPPNEMVAQATSILYATVVSYDEAGAARLQIHEVLAGERVERVDDVRLSCFGGSPALYGLQAGETYLMLLHGDDLFEERSYFEVRGDLEVRFFEGSESHAARAWQPMTAVRHRIRNLRAAKR